MAQKTIDWFEKQREQKPADKIEPNFKVGDWVVSNLYTSKPFCITKICDTHYLVDNDSFIPFEQESDWRLWTIQDAKDGDVLAYDNGCVEIILLFKKWYHGVGKGAYSYAHITSSGHHIHANDWSDCGLSAHPATKEQRDLLFQKMKEEGYEWDAENKKLKKEEVDNLHIYLYGEQKSADNVEPKFKVGDWIVYKDVVWKACNISLQNYYELLKINNEVSTRLIKDVDENAHLWTIQDAKDGDVLYMDNGLSTCTFIYKSIDNVIIQKYASYNKFGFEGTTYLVLNDGYVCPATKEQRDLLFQKMKEAGYEWDAEKKELRNVEQKFIDKIQPKFKVGDIIKNKKNGDTVKVEQILSDSYCYSGWDGAATIHSDFLISDQDNWELVEQNPADNEMIEILRTEYEKGRADAITEFQKEWSEEDEIMFRKAIITIDNVRMDTDSQEYYQGICNWLNSLKDRVQPHNLIITDDELAQAKKDAYNDALDKIEYHSDEPTFDDGWSAAIWYFKKRNMQQQTRWKPSDWQINALELWLKDNHYKGDARYCYPILFSLYQDLKKLKG